MTALAIFGIIYFIVKLIQEACEPQLPASYHRNMELETQDANKVRFGEMSRREFLRNIDNGKYR